MRRDTCSRCEKDIIFVDSVNNTLIALDYPAIADPGLYAISNAGVAYVVGSLYAKHACAKAVSDA